MSSKNIDILNRLSAENKSNWVERAKWREENADWLEKSAEIALQTLLRLKQLGMSQKDFASQMDVSPQYISKMLKGSENLSLETISKVERILDIKLVQIETKQTNAFSSESVDNRVSYIVHVFTEKQDTPIEYQSANAMSLINQA